jgi:hypothetical protein
MSMGFGTIRRWRLRKLSRAKSQATGYCGLAYEERLPYDVYRELRRKGVTLQLVWEEYRAAHPDGYGRSWFCELYRPGKAVCRRRCGSRMWPARCASWWLSTPGCWLIPMTHDPNQLNELARTLAMAADIASVLSIRREILAFLAELAADKPRAQRAQRARARTRRRARELRLRSELIAGEFLLSMRDRGLRQTRRAPSLATLGLEWATAMRWERRAREARRRQDENHADVTAST